MTKDFNNISGGLFSSALSDDDFEQLYLALRQKEGRIYKDEEVSLLPYISNTHPQYDEWKIRTRSFKKLLDYIKHRPVGLSILEVGCGNGWLAARLAAAKAIVTGIDINKTELEQAERVFHKQAGLNFKYGELRNGVLGDEKFAMIIFAASVQYFSPLKEIIDQAIKHLEPGGEIHILDSRFYSQDELMAARQRTKDYYDSLGFPQMANHYYHHSMKALDQYNYTILRDPYSWKNKLPGAKNPFYWVVLKN